MNNYPIDTALNNAEGVFEIDLVNSLTGTTFPRVPVKGANSLGQVLEKYGVEIEINVNSDKVRFTNKRTGEQRSDLGETVADLGLMDGDVLSIADNCGVA